MALCQWFPSQSADDGRASIRARLSVIAMQTFTLIQPDRGIEIAQSLVEAGLAHNVVPGNMAVTCIDAGRDRDDAAQPIQISATCSKLPPRENSLPGEFSIRMVSPPFARSRPCVAAAIAATIRDSPAHGRPAKRTRMQDHILRAYRERPFDLAAKRCHRFLQEQFVGAGHVDQIIGMDDQRPQIVGGAQAIHLVRTGPHPTHRAPTGGGWKKKSETYCSPGDRRARRRCARLRQWRYECRSGGKSGGAGVSGAGRLRMSCSSAMERGI